MTKEEFLSGMPFTYGTNWGAFRFRNDSIERDGNYHANVEEVTDKRVFLYSSHTFFGLIRGAVELEKLRVAK